jgi:hypothetical protein
MTYAEKTAQDICDIINRYGTMPEIVERVEQALRTQREVCVHLVSEILKEHGVGGLQYDSIKADIDAAIKAILKAEAEA